MTSEAQELLKLIDEQLEWAKKNPNPTDEDLFYLGGMTNIRLLVNNFFNAPRPKTEPSPLTEEELKMLMPDMDEVVKTALTVGQGVARVCKDENGNLTIKHVEPEEYVKPVEDAGTKDLGL